MNKMQEPFLLRRILGRDPEDGEIVEVDGRVFQMRHGILRGEGVRSDAQHQTAEAFGFKWERRDTYESAELQSFAREWLVQRYLAGDRSRLDRYFPPGASVLDAGCGAGHSAALLLGDRIPDLRYLGVDISTSVDVARERFSERGWTAEFMQADFRELPFPPGTFDTILAEGTLHHTDSTCEALGSLVPLVRPGGHLLFYVYRRKGPIREYTDDLIRGKLAELTDEEAWEALRPLTRLGEALGALDAEFEVAEPVDVLGIPAGRYDIQRFFYWHVLKVFYRPELDLESMNHINFDWFRPTNAHRQTPEEVAAWCETLGLDVEHEDVQEAGITVVARKRG